MRNWLEGRIQRVVVNGVVSGWEISDKWCPSGVCTGTGAI